MKCDELAKLVSEELGIPEDTVLRTYRAYWNVVRDWITELPLKNDMSEEEFSRLRTNINIPSLGKFHCSYDRYTGIRKRFETIKSIKNYESEED